MNQEDLKKLWEDPQHWGDGPLGGYFCKQDPRLLVPKRSGPGGTFNLAHRWAGPIFTAIMVLLILLVLFSPMRALWKMWGG